MYIDAHQHFWKFHPTEYGWIDDSMAVLRRDFLPSDLTIELNKSGFVGSVAVQARQTIEETIWLLQLADQNPKILGVVGWVDLCSPDAREQLATFAKHPKLVGIRHIVQSEPDDRFLLRPDFLRGVALLEEFDLAYDILIYSRHLPVAAEFVERLPRHRFVLDHMAKPPIRSREIDKWAEGMRRLAAFPNVFCKMSGLVTEADPTNWKAEHIVPYLDVAFEAFGAQRLMIGSDWPVCLTGASYATVMHLVKSYLTPCSLDDRAAILGGNAERFWRLKM